IRGTMPFPVLDFFTGFLHGQSQEGVASPRPGAFGKGPWVPGPAPGRVGTGTSQPPPAHPTESTMTPLRQRMIEDMKLRNLAPRPIAVYTARAAAFARHFGRSPEDLGREEVRSFLLHLVREKRVSWSLYNQTVAALRFLYEVTLDRHGVMVRV